MIYYNDKFNLNIIVESESSLPIFKDVKTDQILKPFLKESNTELMYPMINIKGKLIYCHRIVAYSCLPKTNLIACIKRLKSQDGKYYVVDHKNGNTLDYRPQNLRFLTNSENVKHAVDYMQPVNIKQYKQLQLWKFNKNNYKFKSNDNPF